MVEPLRFSVGVAGVSDLMKQALDCTRNVSQRASTIAPQTARAQSTQTAQTARAQTGRHVAQG